MCKGKELFDQAGAFATDLQLDALDLVELMNYRDLLDEEIFNYEETSEAELNFYHNIDVHNYTVATGGW